MWGLRHAPDFSSHHSGCGRCFRDISDQCTSPDCFNIKLTEKQVEGFIAAQKEMSAVVEKMQSAVLSGQVNAKYQAELEAVTKKNGFKNFAEYEAVAANISVVMAAMDPQTGVFADPRTAIKKEIENASTDKTIPDREKKGIA
jgi:hypothetical protein